MNQQELKDVLDLHRKWLLNECGGKRANLRSADLSTIKDDFFKVLTAAKSETTGLYDALIRGKINGSQYEGECACLVGTGANIRAEKFKEMKIDLRPDADRPAEKWFLGISEGDTPASNPIAKITAEWVELFCAENGIELPRYRFVSSLEMPAAFAGIG